MKPLSTKGYVLIVGMVPPRPSATALVMRNLLSQFDPKSYSVATVPVPFYGALSEELKDVAIHYLIPNIRFSTRINQWWQQMLWKNALKQLIKLIEKIKPIAIVGVYPDEYHLRLAREAAKKTQIPWIAYFQDLYAEQFVHTSKAQLTQKLQDQVFAEASSVIVVNEGMQSFYRQTYGHHFNRVVIAYPEAVPESLPTHVPNQQVFWGGSVYWTANTVKRFAKAASNLKYPMLLATAQNPKSLKRLGILDLPGIERTYYGKRSEYLAALVEQGVLLAGIDFSDESSTEEVELATAFSTKTIEYMASGRPILVNCPKHYFLAQFFEKHQCGLVIADRSVEQLQEAIHFLMQDTAEVRDMRRAALETVASYFAMSQQAAHFSSEIDAIAAVQWGIKSSLQQDGT